MYFPAQTSMMPVTVALARFWEAHGFGATFSNYPYWYLGVPFKYLGGPVIPFLLAGLHRVFPQMTLFEIYFLLVAAFWLWGGVTLFLLVKTLGQRTQTGLLAALIFLLGPFLPWLFPFASGPELVSFSFLPLTLLVYLGILRKWSKGKALLLSILVALLLLIDNLVLPALLIGMLSLFLALVLWGRVGKELKRAILILILGFVLATIWYSPSYWLHLLSAPSFAGKGLSSVVVLLIRLLSVAIPIFLAVFSLRRFRQRKNLLLNFAIFWSFIFGFLTLMRFLSDPDFWQDWTGYALELQLGGAILLGMFVAWLLQSPKLSIVLRSISLGAIIVALTLPWIFAPQKNLGLRRDIAEMVEYRVGKWLVENVKPEERVYLSGTTAFWLNSFFDIAQVRGGFDQGATHPFWDKASFEIREGEDGELAVAWLKALGVSYLVVHGEESEEYYRDFKYPEKFKTTKGLRKVFEEKNDVIYRVEGASLARVVNLKAFEELKPPRDGADRHSVLAYANQLERPLETVTWTKTNQLLIRVEIKEREGLSLAITYDRGWNGETDGQKSGLKIEKDALGNLLLIPSQSGLLNIHITYKK